MSLFRVIYTGLFLILVLSGCARLQARLQIISNSNGAISGSEFIQEISSMPLDDREEKIFQESIEGHVPKFMETLCPITISETTGSVTHKATYYVTPDYWCIGTDEDYFLCPMTPTLAQRLADHFEAVLPTRKMVDDVYKQSALKLTPSPIPPSGNMITVPVFAEHNQTVWKERMNALSSFPLGALVAGHKKDVVVTDKLTDMPLPGRVAIYGWHKPDGKAIQPLYVKHVDFYADYSHGIRLVRKSITVDGKTIMVPDVLKDPELCSLLSDEGPVKNPRYPTTRQK